jgi:hypothetical protein
LVYLLLDLVIVSPWFSSRLYLLGLVQRTMIFLQFCVGFHSIHLHMTYQKKSLWACFSNSANLTPVFAIIQFVLLGLFFVTIWISIQLVIFPVGFGCI